MLPRNFSGHWLTTLRRLGFVLLALFILFGLAAFYHQAYAGRIFPGVMVGPVNLGGLSRPAAEERLQAAWDNFAKQGLPLFIGERRVIMTPIVSSPTDLDLTYELVQFNPEVAVREAYTVGRSGAWWWQFLEPFWVRFSPRHLALPASLETARLLRFIRDSLPRAERQPQSARLVLGSEGEFELAPEKTGSLIEVEALERGLNQRFADLNNEPMALTLIEVQPTLTSTRLEGVAARAQELARGTDLKFILGEQSWRAQPAEWHQWLEARQEGNDIVVGLSASAAASFFSDISKAVNQPAKDAKFEVKDGLVTTFQASQLGQALDVAATLHTAETALQGGGELTVPLSVVVTEPEVTTADTNEFGISEIIGVGRSNFAGSPRNRRSNIRTGAQKLNGVLIKPDEEFSLIKALGKIDASTGYLEELVIKGNKTIPEFGGGLCQIGTTTFRAALASGLPIVERRNHSYRVPYYEPAGTDATIYNPKPDLRFKNDTGGAILIQTRLEGNNLIFEFWGKKDGRVVEQTKPKIYNLVSPPPTKIVATKDLPVGEKKCTEKAHGGADTEFTYTVTYASGEKKEQVFKSHYVPWQEVCLVGVPKGSLQPTTDNNTTNN